MDKQIIISYLIAMEYNDEQIKKILSSNVMRDYIEKSILELEMKMTYNKNSKNTNQKSIEIYTKMLELIEKQNEQENARGLK